LRRREKRPLRWQLGGEGEWNLHRLRLHVRGLGWKVAHESQIPASQLTRLDVYKAVAHGLGVVDSVRGMDFQARSFLLALRTGEPFRIARALGYEACFLAAQGKRSLPRARKLAAELARIARARGEPYLLGWVAGTEGAIAYFSGQFRIAADRWEDAERMFIEKTQGMAWETGSARVFRLLALRRMGAFVELEAEFDRAVRDAARRGDRYTETTYRRLCNLLWLVKDDVEGARDHLQRTSWSPPQQGYHLQHWYELEAEGEIAFYEGSAGAVHASLAPRFAALRASLLPRIQMVRCVSHWLQGRLALAAAQSGDPQASQDAARCAHRLGKERMDYADAFSHLLHAGVASQRGDREQAARHLAAAIPAASATDMHVCVAAAKWRLGELLGGDEGAALLAEARRWMKQEAVANPERMLEVVAPGFGS
jgi:hypothetical protein